MHQLFNMKLQHSHGLVVSVLVLAMRLHQSTALTQQQFAQKVDQLRLAMTNPNDNNGRLTAGAVRLAFHDCVGGCDGCINLQNPDNAGLDVTIEALNRIFHAPGLDGSPPAEQLMSRADFWALSGIVGAEVAADRLCPGGVGPCGIPRPSLVFRSGRRDCLTSPTTQIRHEFPSAHSGTDATLDFFARQFNFSASQSVAIMGAHTLGRTNPEHSGFNGPWVDREDVLDNDYYREVNRNWNQRNIGGSGSSARFQWFRGNRNEPIMLNVDMCLLKEIQVDATGASRCPRSNDCADSRTAGVVRQYSRNNEMWMRDFSEAFQIMIQSGASNLVVPGDAVVDSATTTPPPTRDSTATARNRFTSSVPSGNGFTASNPESEARTSAADRVTTQSVNEDRANGRGDGNRGGRGDGGNRGNRDGDDGRNNSRGGRGDGRGGRGRGGRDGNTGGRRQRRNI